MNSVQSIMEIAYQDAMHQVSRFLKEGQEVTWAVGKYKGRKATVVDVCLEISGEVLVRVKTRAVRKGQYDPDYIDDNDDYHRTYRSPSAFGVSIP